MGKGHDGASVQQHPHLRHAKMTDDIAGNHPRRDAVVPQWRYQARRPMSRLNLPGSTRKEVGKEGAARSVMDWFYVRQLPCGRR